jgi:acyl carrier protein
MSEGMEEKIRKIVAQVAGASNPAELGGDADIFRDIGVQSTAALDLLLSLEEAFGVTIADDAFASARTINSLTKLIGQLS